jgi:colanic acid biosynthesis protein WcaH
MSPTPLNHADLSAVVRMSPIVSIDLIIRDGKNRVLLGLRNNEPARGFFFVPGGRVWKDERLQDAFARILKDETNCVGTFGEARFLGVYEHFYASNRFGEPGYGSHYVALAYEIKLTNILKLRSDAQHSEYCWWDEADLVASCRVHENTKAYFRLHAVRPVE